jgi:VCBS repeat-containing protein
MIRVGWSSFRSLLLASTFLLASMPVAAQTFAVSNTDDSGAGSLRDAITQLNASTACPCTVTFALRTPNDATYDVHRISLLTALPDITQVAVIDGTTVADSNLSGPDVVLDGSAITAPGASGLRFTNSGTGNGVRGLVISGFPLHGLEFNDGGGNDIGLTVERNYIGTTPDGAAAAGNGGSGVKIFSTSGAQVGLVGAGNLISANGEHGISVGTGIISIDENLIGTNGAATADLGNTVHGINVLAANADIGTNAGNTISGNGGSGVYVGSSAQVGIDQSNIGADGSGDSAIGNGGHGIWIDGASFTRIGDNVGNIIAFNGGDGIAITGTGRQNRVTNVSIHSNGGLAIDLGDDGVTPNDPAPDADSGPNDLQNFPVITSAAWDQALGATVITGFLDATPNREYHIRFFGNALPDPSGHGEAENFLTEFVGTTDGSGHLDFTAPVGRLNLTGQAVSAFARDSTIILARIAPNASAIGDTSEMSLSVVVNNPPVANDDSAATPEDTLVPVNVLTNDSDPDTSQTLTIASFTQGANGTVSCAGTTCTYTPNANFNGGDTFTYTITDGIATDTATVTITVNAVNDPPTTVNDAFSATEDTILSVPAPGVLANDSDVDSGSITATLGATPLNGTVVLNPDGSFSYTPNANFNGSDSFTYTATDGTSPSAPATVTINVAAVNDPPVVVNDAYSATEDLPLTVPAPGVLSNDSDPDGNSITAGLFTPPANGTVTLNPNGSFTYTPNANFNGTDSFTYKATDGVTASATAATVTINVAPVNDPPVAVNDAYSTPQNTLLTVAAPGVLGNDSDPETTALTVTLVSGPANGILTLQPDGSFSYTPNTNFVGSDSFTYQASDGSLPSNVATVTINVFSTNLPPDAVDDFASTPQGSIVEIMVTANDTDPDGDALSASLFTPPSNGVASCSGSFCSYTPSAGFVGTDSFIYEVSDGKGGTDKATVFIEVFSCPQAPTQLTPSAVNSPAPLSGTLSWNDVGAGSYVVYFGPAGSGCSTPHANVTGTSLAYSGLALATTYEWRVEAVGPDCPTVSSACVTFHTACLAPQLLQPEAGEGGVVSPVRLEWTPVTTATLYEVYLGPMSGSASKIAETTATTWDVELPDGAYQWYVIAVSGSCKAQSLPGAFSIGSSCESGGILIVSVPGEVNTGEDYRLRWTNAGAGVSYEVHESLSPDFATFTSFTVPALEIGFNHTADVPTGYYYRVRAVCPAGPAEFAPPVRIVVIPLPDPAKPPVLNTELGNDEPIVTKVLVPYPQGVSGTVTFTAQTDKPWLSIAPAAGVVPPDGVLLTLTASPSGLGVGAHYGSIIITYSTPDARIAPNGTTTSTIPVSLSLVTPVTSLPKGGSSASSLIIPAVAHVDGANSHWQSDIRLLNTLGQNVKYLLSFTPSGVDGTKSGKQTTFDVPAGGLVALDDIVKQWFGLGSLGDGTNGVLDIRPLNTPAPVPGSALSTVVSSRTFTSATTGTYGQFIPAIPFANFLGADTQKRVLSLQQIAQNESYRTNFGLVEGSGMPATVELAIFSVTGQKLRTFTFNLKPAEHLQLNGLLAQNGIELREGRAEVTVTSKTGRVTAYASLVDSRTNDPLLVPAADLSKLGSTSYVVPGVADFSNERNQWRTDLRMFNASPASVLARVTFYPQDDPAGAQSVQVSINPGEVKVVDDVVESMFGRKNVGGAIHVTTGAPSALVVTARTYDDRGPAGTYGQFIPAITSAEGFGVGDRGVQVLQLEESSRFRTNLGIAEVAGKTASIEVSASLPDSTSTPVLRYQLKPNEFKQIVGVFREMGLSNVYNARITVKVVGGTGEIAAYGSVVDNFTQDPTFVPGQ